MINHSFNQHGESSNTPLIPHDECIVTIDDAQYEHDQARFNGSPSSIDSELTANIPKLPGHKDKHLFISHSSEDFKQVMDIVNELEECYSVSCIIADRDFQPGKKIVVNIKESIGRSLKTVIMLTPHFVKSGYCTIEQEYAIMTGIESGINSVIPVLLQECDIPALVATVIFIDGTLPGVNIPAKIAQALAQSELAKESLTVDYHVLSKKYENGYCLPIVPKKVKVWCGLKPSEYIFYANEDYLKQLRQAKVKLPTEVINEAIYVVNKRRLASPDEYFNRCYALSVILMFGLLDIFLRILVTWHFSSKYHLLAVSICAILVIVVTSKKLKRNYLSKDIQNEVNLELWEAIGETCIQHNSIVFVEEKWTQSYVLNIMRYDTTECKMYLAGLIRSRETERTEQSTSPESEADEKIRRALKRLMPHLSSNLVNIPDAPYNRHPVRMSKMCLCQMIEAGSPLVN